MSKELEIILLQHAPDNAIPVYQTIGSSGMDLRSAVNAIMLPMSRQSIQTGIKICFPTIGGIEGQIRSRSGLALNHGIVVLNSPATIDSDYRGEIKVLLYNSSPTEYEIRRGDRIAQLVISRTIKITWNKVDNFRDIKITACEEFFRGEKGFGSTGM